MGRTGCKNTETEPGRPAESAPARARPHCAGPLACLTGVISCAERDEKFAELIKYLIMARKKGVKDAQIDSTLILAYAKTNRLSELEEFISGPNVAKIQARRCRSIHRIVGGGAKLASARIIIVRHQARLLRRRSATAATTTASTRPLGSSSPTSRTSRASRRRSSSCSSSKTPSRRRARPTRLARGRRHAHPSSRLHRIARAGSGAGSGAGSSPCEMHKAAF